VQLVVTAIPSPGVDTPVSGVYDDAKVVPPEAQPTGTILLRFIQSKYVAGTWPRTLKSNWVEDLPNITSSEGARRVEQCYTAAQQRAGALIQQNDILQYGTDTTAWPAAEQQRYTEMQRGLDFIHAMNAAQQTIVNQGILNPCDDQYWPAPIDPIQL
jgi:hypothetical protein